MIDQRTKGARPDIVRTDQPQPVDPLLVGEVCGVGCSDVHAALPAQFRPTGGCDQLVLNAWTPLPPFRDAPSGAGPESRDSGFDAEPVIGPRLARTRWHRPGMTVFSHPLARSPYAS